MFLFFWILGKKNISFLYFLSNIDVRCICTATFWLCPSLVPATVHPPVDAHTRARFDDIPCDGIVCLFEFNMCVQCLRDAVDYDNAEEAMVIMETTAEKKFPRPRFAGRGRRGRSTGWSLNSERAGYTTAVEPRTTCMLGGCVVVCGVCERTFRQMSWQTSTWHTDQNIHTHTQTEYSAAVNTFCDPFKSRI